MSLAIASLVVVPLCVVFSAWLNPDWAVWNHLAETVLSELLTNTLVLLLGVGISVLLLGTSLAWLTTMFEFPARRVLDWALMLPLAMPAYVLAFVTLGLFDFAGPVQALLTQLFGANGYWFPEIRSSGGVILVLSLALYPYVYMLARSAFAAQGWQTLEAARTLGLTPWQGFLRVALPMARPALAAGMALALMETLADFGAVAVFNYDTFTTAIYKAWFGLFNLAAAAQLASILLVFAFIALLIEQQTRGRSRYHTQAAQSSHRRHRLRGWRAWGASAYSLLVLSLAFLLPLVQLLAWVVEVLADDLDARYLDLAGHTLTLGVIAALLTVSAAFLLSVGRRYYRRWSTVNAARIATLGYALPGSVLAVGVMLSFTWLDGVIDWGWQQLFDSRAPLLLAGSLVGLLLAYVVRFMAVPYGPIDSSLERLRPSLRDAARSLGAGPWRTLKEVLFPFIRPGLLTGLLMVMVDVMKEMPATLLLRPFGWDTFAVRIYEMTSEGEWERAALPAVTLVIVGLLPVLLLVRRTTRY